MQKPLKIIFDASPLLGHKTGIAYYIEQLVSHLAQQYPNDVELIGFYYNFLGRKDIHQLPVSSNIRYRPVRLLPSKIIYQLRRFGIETPLELLAKERADFALFGNFLGYPSLFKIPSAPVIHDLTYLDLPDYVAAKNRSDLQRFVPRQLQRSRFVLTVSEFSKQKIQKTYNIAPKDIVVTPIPAARPHTIPAQRSSDIIKGLGITQPFILFVGTIEPRKNITALIAAYEQLPDVTKNQYSLVITGKMGWNCEKEQAALALAKEKGLHVIHVGYVSDTEKAALYQSAYLFTTASHYEGFGMPVLEAMSYGIPCAVSDIAVFHEVAEKAALYFDQNDPASIALTWQTILSNPKQHDTLTRLSKQQATVLKWQSVATKLYERIRQEVYPS